MDYTIASRLTVNSGINVNTTNAVNIHYRRSLQQMGYQIQLPRVQGMPLSKTDVRQVKTVKPAAILSVGWILNLKENLRQSSISRF